MYVADSNAKKPLAAKRPGVAEQKSGTKDMKETVTVVVTQNAREVNVAILKDSDATSKAEVKAAVAQATEV